MHWLIEDGPAPELATLVALADLVNDLRRARKRTLVHCAGGINRSSLLSAGEPGAAPRCLAETDAREQEQA